MISIPCVIGNRRIERAMVNLGASINVIPYSVYYEMNLGPIKETEVIIKLANRPKIYSLISLSLITSKLLFFFLKFFIYIFIVIYFSTFSLPLSLITFTLIISTFPFYYFSLIFSFSSIFTIITFIVIFSLFCLLFLFN